jgi:pSer/pThr/pTyr-binding forkhead associated (FHA) protein
MSDTEQTRMMGATGATVMPGGDRTMVVPPSGATMQMPAGGWDAARTQMGGTTTCLVCGTTTPQMETYCGECGFLLSSSPVGDMAAPQDETPAAELVDINDGRRFRLRPGNNTLGRQGTDILIMDATISRTHAAINVEDGVVTVTDLGSSNGTKVGDVRLAPNQSMQAFFGTPLKFGNWRCTLEIASSLAAGGNAEATVMANRTVMAPPPDATVMDTGVPALNANAPAPVVEETPVLPTPAVTMLQKQSGPGDDIPIQDGTLTIGRKAGNDIIITEDPYISGKHASLTYDSTGVYLTDVGSTNGTVINGQKMIAHEPQLLFEGDEVQLGRTKYRFVLGKSPEISESHAGFAAEDDESPAEVMPPQ